MAIVQYESPAEFLQCVGELLYQAEAENNLLLGLTERLISNPKRSDDRRWLLSVEDGAEVVGAAWVSEPNRNLAISRIPTCHLKELSEYLVYTEVALTGCVGPETWPAQFAKLWQELTGQQVALKFNQRIYSCSKVIQHNVPSGKLRAADASETDLILDWGHAFVKEVGVEIHPGVLEEAISLEISNGQLFIWYDGGPVTCATAFRETRNGMTVTRVYTPPELRRRGYATAAVAGVTQLSLDRGKQFCSLYTDLANPTSNSIYQKIGYQPVCDSQQWEFSCTSQ